MRRFQQVAERKFGAKALDAIFKDWKRDDLTDPALNLTEKRLDDAVVKITNEVAELKIKWQKGDGLENPAFCFGGTIEFRKVNGNWKIDANKMAGIRRGADFLATGGWGKAFRDSMIVNNDAIKGIESGKLKTVKELQEFLKARIEAAQKKYCEEVESQQGKLIQIKPKSD